jgi:hypothetical protein
LVILTGGKKLIDEPISLVVDRHRVVQGDPGLHGTVASFIDGRGETLSLIATADRTIGSSATLEDVVLGYLAAGQDRWPSAGQPAKTGTDRPATSVVSSADARSGVRTAEVLEALARGETQREILDRYPDLSAADIQAALRSAAEAARSREASPKS